MKTLWLTFCLTSCLCGALLPGVALGQSTEPVADSTHVAGDVIATESTIQPATPATTQPAVSKSETSSVEEVSKTVTAGGTSAVALVSNHQAWSHYEPVVDRNIFVRYHTSRKGGSGDTQTTKPSQPEHPSSPTTAPRDTWILTGVVLQGSEHVAFFENASTNMTLRVHAGQDIGQSRVTRITPDQVEVRTGQATQNVTLGESLDGSGGALSANSGGSIFGDSDAEAGSTTTDQAAGGTTATTSGATSQGQTSGGDAQKAGDLQSVIERMRARRQQEAGK